MANHFEEVLMKDIFTKNSIISGNLLKAKDIDLKGYSKIALEEDEHDDVRIYLKKDANDNVKEIKFVCSCGQTKSIILDYSE
ncbi:MAG: hypothetical protein GYA14_11475 [Ignavibacteria bacterium]|nr:hypothetical protein [Ignavibacteria bacterium]